MRTLKNLAFLADDLTLGSPAQQLLDRFLIGYPRDGSFQRLEGCQITLWLPPGISTTELNLRVKDCGLAFEKDLNTLATHADGIVVMPRDPTNWSTAPWMEPLLAHTPAHTPLFVYGSLGHSLSEARRWMDLAEARNLQLLAGTATTATWRLPELDFPPGAGIKEALIVVQGPFPQAELDGLEGLFPLLEKRAGGESGIRQVQFLDGADLWQTVQPGTWSWPLLAAAISRSDSPQGDPVRDGRTQDLVGLGLVPKLARQPRGWLLRHADGLQSMVLVLDGVVADFNLALRTSAGKTLSTQLYHPPAPAQHHFSRLAGWIEDYFRTAQPPWPAQRNLRVAALLEAFSELHASRQTVREMKTGGH